MSAAKSRLRTEALDELRDLMERGGVQIREGVEERGGVQREVDRWLVYDAIGAMRTVFVGRWHDPDTKVAIQNARDALADLERAMHDEVVAMRRSKS